MKVLTSRKTRRQIINLYLTRVIG